jgi:hypothetical protein
VLAEYGLPVVLSEIFTSFEACDSWDFSGLPGIFRRVAQIFENLVGRKYLLRQNSGFLPGEILTSLTISNESLIPAQNQRWRRA